MLNTFDITDFGARADGKTDCTAAKNTGRDLMRFVFCDLIYLIYFAFEVLTIYL